MQTRFASDRWKEEMGAHCLENDAEQSSRAAGQRGSRAAEQQSNKLSLPITITHYWGRRNQPKYEFTFLPGEWKLGHLQFQPIVDRIVEVFPACINTTHIQLSEHKLKVKLTYFCERSQSI